ncbi:MAG TPA: NAD(P)/FAD-dependent oxidoreductase [Actinomycetota bacterium]
MGVLYTFPVNTVVIGAGHNGLVAACYLARAGVGVTVLERAPVVGGAAVTEEIIPGFSVSTASYSLSLLRPDIASELGLAGLGLRLLPKDPQLFVPLADGQGRGAASASGGGRGAGRTRSFFVWRDATRTASELRTIHGPDGDAYPRWLAFWEEAVSVFRPLVEDPDPPAPAEIEASLARQGRSELWRLAVAGSAEECVSAFFESEEVRGAFASQGIIGTAASPRHPGTAWILTYHQLGGELIGADGTWAYVQGGMGSVTRALATAAARAGTVIRTEASVASVLVDDGRAVGVRLEDGEELRADAVLSNADPLRTFLGLLPAGTLQATFEERVRAWRTDGAVVKVNLALAELPEYTARPGRGPQHEGTLEISPSVGYLHRAWEESAAGSMSSQPFMEVFLQTAVDPALAPKGRHVASAFTQYAPASRAVDRAGALETVLRTLGAYAPNLPGAVIDAQVLGPDDLERRFGLTGGDIFHGSMLPNQSFGARFGYATPVPGLFLCGSGARPGGCVMGAAGRNCARTVLLGLGGRGEGSY